VSGGSFIQMSKSRALALPSALPLHLSPKSPLCSGALDAVGKVFEKLIFKRLNLAIEAAGGLSPNQFGFRKEKSTVKQSQGSQRKL